MRRNNENETKMYTALAYGAMFAEFTVIIGFFIAFIALLFWAGII